MKKIFSTTWWTPLRMILAAAAALLLIGGYFTVKELFDGDPDVDPRWYREMHIDTWSHLIGDERGLLSVKEKLETMYGSGAPEIKVDRANPSFTEGNWYYEWVQLAEGSLAKGDYFAAAGYYAVADYPELYGDTHAQHLYDLALNAFEKGLQQDSYPYKIITVNVDGADVHAYVVYPQSYKEGEAVPAIIETGGLDNSMMFMFADYMLHWNKANVAWVGFDIPGFGASRELTLNYEVEKIHAAVIKALRADDSIDPKNIFVYSRSMGGAAGLRLVGTGQADELDLAGVAAVCPLTISTVRGGTLGGLIAVNTLPDSTLNPLGARLRIDPANTWELALELPTLESAFKEYWGKTVTSVPLMVCTGEHEDSANTPADLEVAAKLSENGSVVIATGASGHCPGLDGSLEAVAKFVSEHIR